MAIFRKILLGLVGLGIGLYCGLCAYLFAIQRSLIYYPRPATAAPAGYAPLAVDVPGIGVLQDWRLPAQPGKPTVIFFHGNGDVTTSFSEFGMRLHAHGWGVVLAGYPGYSGNPGQPTESNLMAAARATIAAARANRVIVWGHSLGSGVAARMAAEGRAQGLVLEAPYTSLPNVAAMVYPYIPVHLLMRDRFDTQSLTGRIKMPVLIFHSIDDAQIPFSMGDQLASTLHACLVKMQGAGHYPQTVDLTDMAITWVSGICPAALPQTGG
jgi:pimeloyl-ACP methyl ester carboxylesterase